MDVNLSEDYNDLLIFDEEPDVYNEKEVISLLSCLLERCLFKEAKNCLYVEWDPG